jgi:hypothetical protein
LPAPAALPHLGEVFARASFLGEERAESHVNEHRHADNGQRNQEKLNSESGRSDEWIPRRVFALDEFFHESGIW